MFQRENRNTLARIIKYLRKLCFRDFAFSRSIKVVDQPEYGKNTCYLTDFIQITHQAKMLNSEEIRDLFVNHAQSAAQIAKKFGVAKTVILSRLHGLGVAIGTSAPGRMTNPSNYRCATRPYGFTVKDGRLVPNKSELRICRVVVELYGRQKLSATAVAKELTRRGFKNRAGRIAWEHKTVQSIFIRWNGKI
jgi:hypothetical protein